ncbi:hypothetical protein Ddye_011832 [Dipteronia dyeriana]|uniref:Uncharacterized protein n=1 Tax=Dipteronia dyeriana TaxID=168575 RepID=A0AAD9X376_9ROSI|nr:hypothetical protein Ddye_011832 [Dipteronia dyeriana]
MTADEVEFQVKMALDGLRGDTVEYRRFAAVLIWKLESSWRRMLEGLKVVDVKLTAIRGKSRLIESVAFSLSLCFQSMSRPSDRRLGADMQESTCKKAKFCFSIQVVVNVKVRASEQLLIKRQKYLLASKPEVT